MTRLRVPQSTYRLQLNGNFTFRDAAAIVPYLDALGISHLYASPFLKARAGSMHGYDIVDHRLLNPEIGSAQELQALHQQLRDHHMGQIMDLVPNHMGVGGDDNQWWLDVLEYGQASRYAVYFDIDWQPVKEELRNKVLLPVLDDQYGAVLERGGIELKFDPERGEFSAWFYNHRFPIDPGTYGQLLQHVPEAEPALQDIGRRAAQLPPRSDCNAEQAQSRRSDAEAIKQELVQWYGSADGATAHMDSLLRSMNGTAGEPESFAPLHRLLESQAYRLAWWRVASDEINYRRFFDINDLAGLRMELQEVFDATHGLVGELLRAGALDGLRIDHPDGLRDPKAYFQQLRERLETDNGDDFYLVVEKILANYERLPADWPVQGTTGYEFMYLTNNLLVDGDGQAPLTRMYHRFVGRNIDYGELLYERKKLIIRNQLSSELTVLANLADGLAQANPKTRDFTLNGLRDALIEIVANFPVYRTYITAEGISDEDRRYIHWALALARKRSTGRELRIFDFLEQMLQAEYNAGGEEFHARELLRFAMRAQQYTAPVMAKAMEDTTFYIYNRLVCLNEVGGEPHIFGISTHAFHRANRERLEHWPHAMLSSSTHDSKRSEDVRARLAVLSEMPQEWAQHLRRWRQLNRAKASQTETSRAPSRNDEYLIYQTLLGAWPLETLDQNGIDTFQERLEQYLIKAMREAKVHTSWLNPDEEYEQATLRFLRALLHNPDRNAFLADFLPFQQRVSRFGLCNSLSALTWKLTAPGVPDVYQGNELWSFDLVDPDNRRPVDYGQRRTWLQELQGLDTAQWPARLEELGLNLEDPRAKLWVTWRLLGLRRQNPDLFRDGDYVPVQVEGAFAAQVCAYLRRHQGESVLVVTGLRWSRLPGAEQGFPVYGECWRDTRLSLSAGGPDWENLLDGSVITATDEAMGLGALLRRFPVAVLRRRES